MRNLIFDLSDGDFLFQTSDDTAMDMNGDFMIRMSDNMAMDLNSGELHITSEWDDEEFNLNID